MKSITREEIMETMVRRDAAILDVRPMSAYNGWPLRGETRGGHLPGARPFPLSWFETLGKDGSKKALLEKGVPPHAPLAVYGDGPADARSAATLLEDMGFGDVGVYEEGFFAWQADPDARVERMARYRHLVYPGWLRAVMDGEEVMSSPRGPVVLAHVNFDNKEDYTSGHIPGAIHLDTLNLESPDGWNRRSPAELQEAFERLGVTHDTTLILYGRCAKPTMEDPDPGKRAGQIAAMRAALISMYSGVEDVRVLDGGLDAWQATGYAVVTGETPPEAAPSFGKKIPARPELIVDMEEARRMLGDPRSDLVSVRSWAEFTGELSGYHYVGPKGRIPGAVFGNCGSDAYHMQNYRNHDNSMRDYKEIERNWEEVKITPDKRVAFYCGTGWRASEAFFCAYLVGWERIAIYDGGWLEWSSNPDNPIETGVPSQTADPLS